MAKICGSLEDARSELVLSKYKLWDHSFDFHKKHLWKSIHFNPYRTIFEIVSNNKRYNCESLSIHNLYLKGNKRKQILFQTQLISFHTCWSVEIDFMFMCNWHFYDLALSLSWLSRESNSSLLFIWMDKIREKAAHQIVVEPPLFSLLISHCITQRALNIR